MMRPAKISAVVLALALTGCAGKQRTGPEEVQSPGEGEAPPVAGETAPVGGEDAPAEGPADDVADDSLGPTAQTEPQPIPDPEQPATAEPTGETPAEPAAKPQPQPLELLAGEYKFSGGQKQRDGVKSAIEEVVDQMSAFARNIARDRLTEANDVPARVEIENKGKQITVKIDETTYTAALGGQAVQVPGDQGKPSKMRFVLRGKSLYQYFDGDEGDRINVFSPRSDGKGLTMKVTMKSSRLPDEIEYRLSYRETAR